MQKRTREIVALIMLLALVVAGLSFMGWYIKAGHNWNVAATTIDDRFGQMDGYVVVLYKGTTTPMEERVQQADVNQQANPNQRTGRDQQVDASATTKAAASEELLLERSQAETLLLDQSRSSYQQKGARVVVLESQSPELYQKPSVIVQQGYKIGVFSVSQDTPYLAIDAALSYFASHEVDVVVAMEESQNEYVESVRGVDIVIAVGEEPLEEVSEAEAEADARGERVSGQSASSAQSGSATKASAGSADSDVIASPSAAEEPNESEKPQRSNAFFVGRYDFGTIAAILISPNNLVSAKTITE